MNKHGRRAQEVAHDQDVLVVPAIDERAGDRAEQEVRQRRRDEHEGRRERRARGAQHGRRQGELMDPIAEQRDQLSGPQRR